MEEAKADGVNDSVITLHGDRWSLDLVWWLHHQLYKCRITMLYT